MDFSQKFQTHGYIFVKFIKFRAVFRIHGCFQWLSSPIGSGVMADHRSQSPDCSCCGPWRVETVGKFGKYPQNLIKAKSGVAPYPELLIILQWVCTASLVLLWKSEQLFCYAAGLLRWWYLSLIVGVHLLFKLGNFVQSWTAAGSKNPQKT